jgi:hypothetical protein
MYLTYKTISNYEEANKLLPHYFTSLDNFHIEDGISYKELVERLDLFQVRRGTECVDKNEPLFKVSLLKLKDKNEFMIVMSVSHVIADGCTFYQLHNMLDWRLPVKALQVQRLGGDATYDAALTDIIGPQAVSWLSSPLLLQGMSGCASRQSPPMSVHFVEVSASWVAHQKQQQQQEGTKEDDREENDVEFISTNDILAAWHNRVCQASFSLMSVNLRNRVPQFRDDMAGNYETALVYNGPSDCHDPLSVRRSLRSYRSASGSCPSEAQTLVWNASLTTNWCTFYREVQLVGPEEDRGQCCEHVLHLPVADPAELAVWQECAIVFRAGAQRTCLMLATRSDAVREALQEVGRPLSLPLQ